MNSTGRTRRAARFSSQRLAWWVLLLTTLVIAKFTERVAQKLGRDWLDDYPTTWVKSPADAISKSTKWLINDATFGLFTFTELTRGIAFVVEQPYNWALAVLSKGFMDGIGRRADQILPALSWIAVIVLVAALGHYAKSWRLSAVVSALFVYLAVFGQWESSMVTLASMVIAVPIGAGVGLLLGLWSYHSPPVERAITPVLDLMQTIPTFAYLVPILFFFGFGPVSALIATIVYAMPPMARITTLAVRGVDPDIKNFGEMIGCSKHQMTWRILVPAAKTGLMVGVNQVIMLSLNMVIIASMIGAGGLGYDVLESLRRLDIGRGLEAGLAIVVLAIALDRLSQAFAVRGQLGKTQRVDSRATRRWPRIITFVIAVIVTFVIGKAIAGVQTYPESLQITTGSFWDDIISWINVNFFDTLESIKVFLLEIFLLPIKRLLLVVPWWWTITLVTTAGWTLGRLRLALICFASTTFIAVCGLWEFAMFTVYLCGASVLLSMIIGVPLGIWATQSERASRVIGLAIDTLQTLPSFVYLIPVVMLFRVGDFTALIAIVLYALAPAVRYTWHGIRGIDEQVVEAALVSGCTSRQLLTRVKLPLALPEILLGLNQTIMLALSMLVITALVGTRDLGQEVYVALVKADTGRGLVAGLAIALIAITADRLIGAAAKGARQRYGIVR